MDKETEELSLHLKDTSHYFKNQGKKQTKKTNNQAKKNQYPVFLFISRKACNI